MGASEGSYGAAHLDVDDARFGHQVAASIQTQSVVDSETGAVAASGTVTARGGRSRASPRDDDA